MLTSSLKHTYVFIYFFYVKHFSPSDHQDHELLGSHWNLALQARLSDPVHFKEKKNEVNLQTAIRLNGGKNGFSLLLFA